jgi:hypothetical protein
VDIINLDAASWAKVLDFYEALFAALGVPSWQGYGVAATIDTVIWHKVDRVEPPYLIRVENLNRAPDSVVTEVKLLQQCIVRARAEHLTREGNDVEVEMEIVS